jgi:Cu/Ag efflux pump CusA
MNDKDEKKQIEILLDDSHSGIYRKPFSLLIITLIILFWLESIIMLTLIFLPSMTMITELFIDALLLSLISFPILYILLIRPLKLQMKENEKLREEIRRLESELH